MNSVKSLFIGILFIAAMFAAFMMGYEQGQYNLYVRQCVQEGGSLFEEQLPCVFKGRVNKDVMKRMTMLCDDPRRAYNVETSFVWRHYCE